MVYRVSGSLNQETLSFQRGWHSLADDTRAIFSPLINLDMTRNGTSLTCRSMMLAGPIEQAAVSGESTV
ncbi:hypothetical protein DYI23_02335 [Roseibium polysiphoniae]|uniref:Uncharacterized protein n=1 Tax=Roseibium polysiphoniae TaxID=2571221 RepID=A0A944GRX4_9HYPH|nr:hypothetical protein [Roseibium polysiphoniae]